jgi:transposase
LPVKRARLQAWLPGWLEVAADATLAEHTAAFADQTGLRVSLATMCRAIAGLPAASAGAALTPRARWRTAMGGIDPVRLVFVDECGTHASMTRRRARAVRGARARGAVPRNRGPVTTLLAGLSLTGMSPAMTVQGGTTAAVFAAYLERVLTPALRPGQLVVVDNVGAHKPERMAELVHAAGCELVFLPAYSPDLSPVEGAFSKIKTRVKAASARTHQALDTAIAAALEAVTPADAAGWFAHAGYLSPTHLKPL